MKKRSSTYKDSTGAKPAKSRATAFDWSKVGISDNFMFGKVMSDPERCKELLRRIFPDMDITDIRLSQAESAVNEDKETRGIRIDLYVDGHTAANDDIDFLVEMQTTDERNLPCRIRFEQGLLDLKALNKSDSYVNIKQTCIIYICTFDFFRKMRYRYDFKRVCLQDRSVVMEDRSQVVVLNSKGRGEIVQGLKNFLDYVEGREVVGDDFISGIDGAVKEARKSRDFRRDYMNWSMEMNAQFDRGRIKGREEGRKEGREEGMAKGRKEGRKEGREEGMAKGFLQALSKLVKDSVISLKEAAAQANMSEEQFEKAVKAYGL